MTTTTAARARFFLAYEPKLFVVGHPRLFFRTVFVILPLASLLCVPQISRLTGIAPAFSLTILSAWTLWLAISTLILGPRFERSRAAFYFACNGNLFMCIATALGLVLATGDPQSLLWLGYCLYACINGTIPTRHGRGFLLLCHTLGPFLLVPLFVHAGTPLARAWSGAALASVFSFIGFAYLTTIANVGLSLQAERDQALARLREREDELDRQRIARELHDSLGSTLGLVGMYADLVERHVDEPQELCRISSLVRDAANEGLSDLRGLLSALSPQATSFGALASSVGRLARRTSTLAGAEVSVAPEGDAERLVPGSVRLALVRSFQEGVRNALRHGAAKRIRARLLLDDGAACLELEDDGAGLTAGHGDGVGLTGMRARAEELGGSFEVINVSAGGTQLRVRLPLAGSPAR